MLKGLVSLRPKPFELCFARPSRRGSSPSHRAWERRVSNRYYKNTQFRYPSNHLEVVSEIRTEFAPAVRAPFLYNGVRSHRRPAQGGLDGVQAAIGAELRQALQEACPKRERYGQRQAAHLGAHGRERLEGPEVLRFDEFRVETLGCGVRNPLHDDRICHCENLSYFWLRHP